MEKEIAASLITEMTSQIDLLISLSTGICGGLVAIAIQIIFNNSNPDRSTNFRNANNLFYAFFLEGISIFFGYHAQASIVASIPVIYRLPFPKNESFTDANFPSHIMIKIGVMGQFLLFFLGILFVLHFMYRNINLVKGKKHETSQFIYSADHSSLFDLYKLINHLRTGKSSTNK